MKRSLSQGSIIHSVVFSSLLLLPRLAFPGQLAPQQELTLLVYTYTDFSPHQTKEIKGRVTFIYAYAGIRINWLDCSKRTESDQVPTACAHPPGATDLVIRLLDQSISKASSRMASLGHSYASGNGGWYGSVCCATVKDLARGDRDSEIEILGHAVAHEIGHLLLGAQAHTKAGIMKAQWMEKDLSQMMKTNGLLFSEEQAKRLRICLSARLKEAEAHRVADLQGQR